MKTALTVLSLSLVLFVTACSGASQPLTKEEQAQKYNITVEEMDEMSAAAARMNMSLEDHMKMMEE